ncbi:MAG: O-antigen ligase family protein [Acidobacteriota bacterium]
MAEKNRHLSISSPSCFDAVVFFLLLAASPLFLFPSPSRSWILILLPVLLISRKWICGEFFVRTPYDAALFILIIQIVVSSFLPNTRAESMPKSFGLVFGIAVLYGLVALCRTEKLLRWGYLLFVFGGGLFGLLSLLTMFRYNVKQMGFLFKLTSLLPQIDLGIPGLEEGLNPNAVGGILVLVLPAAIAVVLFEFFRSGSRMAFFSPLGDRVVFWGGTFVMGLTLLLTQSRGSWGALAAGLLFFLLQGRRSRLIGLLLIVLLIGTYFSFLGMDRTGMQLEVTKDRVGLRLDLWGFALETISRYPLTGVGMNRIRSHPEVGYTLSHVHNHALQTAAEMGLPAFVALISLWISAFYMAFFIWKRASFSWMKTAALGLSSGLFAHIVFGLGDSIPLGAKMGVFFWAALALLAALFRFCLHVEKTDSFQKRATAK